MCGRFLLDEPALQSLKHHVSIPDFVEIPLGLVFPSQPALVIKKGPSGLEGDIRRFGLELDRKRIINARSETVLEKPLFAKDVRASRCLVPAAAFYEWDAEKTMVTFREADHPCMYLAGFLQGRDFVILTTAPNASVAPWHERMPLVLPFELGKSWIMEENRIPEILSYRPGPLENNGPLKLF